MTDLMYLTKLLNHIEATSFLLLVEHQLGEQWLLPDRKLGKRSQRDALLEQVRDAQTAIQQQLSRGSHHRIERFSQMLWMSSQVCLIVPAKTLP